MKIDARKASPDTYILDIYEPHTTVISFKATRSFSLKLDEIAKQFGMSKSELIRTAITEFLKSRGIEVRL